MGYTVKRLVSIEPQVEYIYAPDSDFKHLRAKVLKMKEHSPYCKAGDLICRFDKPCHEVSVGRDLDLKIRIYDPSQRADIVIDGDDLLIPGEQVVGAEGAGRCYVGI
jgi:hypothetical protein